MSAKAPNYREIETLIRDFKPFKHASSMSAYNNGKEYLIYSYRTLICSVNLEDGKIDFDASKYSVTTSKQQSLIKRALGIK